MLTEVEAAGSEEKPEITEEDDSWAVGVVRDGVEESLNPVKIRNINFKLFFLFRGDKGR